LTRLVSLFSEHVDFVARTLRRLGVDAADVEDQVQEVFLIANAKLADLEIGKERSFLFGVAVRIASNKRRTQRRAREHVEGGPSTESFPLEARPSNAPAPEEIVDQRRARELLDDILTTMPIELRTVFVLFELEGMTTPEMATLLDVPLGTAASRLRRAREHFEEHVERAREARETRAQDGGIR
jgi:RNA polymerase sigma-70 factor (ECF subfamily)